jgi:hypothetical protein
MSSMSSNDAQLIEFLTNISTQVNRYFSMFIFLIGTVGNILNLFILSQQPLRKIPCIFFFFISSIASLITTVLGLITRMLSGWTTDPTYTIGWLCKLRTYLVFSSRPVVFWLFVLATIDRWLSSSIQTRHRQFSTMQNAQRGTLLVIITSMIVYGQLFYCYDANLVNAPFKCYAKTSTCQILTDVTFAIFTTIMPLLCMFTFGLLTISNIRNSQRRIFDQAALAIIQLPTSTKEYQRRLKKTERHLLFMVFAQIIVLAVLTLPQAIQRLYAAFIGSNQSQLQAAVNIFVYNIVLLLTYLASAMPFYIYTLTGGSLFRKALLKLPQMVPRCRHR